MTLSDGLVQKKICSAYLKTNKCNKIQFENSKLIHNCAKDLERKINRQILSNNLKGKARTPF